MTDNTSQGPQGTQAQSTQAQGTQAQGTQAQATASVPVRFVRGNASPEELSAVIAIVAVATAGGSGEPGPADRSSPGNGTSTRSPWSSPTRMVRVTHPHGPGGWRGSVSPR